MKTLICDLGVYPRGHNLGFIQYLIDNIQPSVGNPLYFLFNSSATKYLCFGRTCIPANHFRFTEDDFLSSGWRAKLKKEQWLEIEKHMADIDADKLFLMDLGQYEVQIGLNNFKFRISGLAFRPSHRIVTHGDGFYETLMIRIKKAKKVCLEHFMLRSRAIERIFILNDDDGAEALNRYHRKDIFRSIPDPIFDYPSEGSSTYEIDEVSHKVTYLIFGSINRRKNVVNILEAFLRLPRELLCCVRLLIVGTVDGEYLKEFEKITLSFISKDCGAELVVLHRFVPDTEMEHIFRISDVFLAIYQDFYGSSGLIGRAAKYNITSVVSNVGVLADLCVKYSLGYLCSPSSIQDIAAKLQMTFEDVIAGRGIDGQPFYQDHCPQLFLKKLQL